MEDCFVIQPFDKDKYDKRFTEIFEPAIIDASLQPYRVDRDPFVRVPIDHIEDGIRKARICFAEISTDNPNVWYELGYAFARDKDVVMVCSEERQNKFPFDIQHKHIITYKTSSISDYESLGRNITNKLKAFLQKSIKVQNIIDTPVKESEGLQQHEVTMMFLILENQMTEEDSVSVFNLQSDMERAGFTKAASNLALRELKRKGLVDTFKEYSEYNNGEYLACRLLQSGEGWLRHNQDKIEFKRVIPTGRGGGDSLPF
jgi:hypothetical protein